MLEVVAAASLVALNREWHYFSKKGANRSRRPWGSILSEKSLSGSVLDHAFAAGLLCKVQNCTLKKIGVQSVWGMTGRPDSAFARRCREGTGNQAATSPG